MTRLETLRALADKRNLKEHELLSCIQKLRLWADLEHLKCLLYQAAPLGEKGII